jgi:hypothetical protein
MGTQENLFLDDRIQEIDGTDDQDEDDEDDGERDEWIYERSPLFVF